MMLQGIEQENLTGIRRNDTVAEGPKPRRIEDAPLDHDANRE